MKEILQDEEDLSEIVQLVGKVYLCTATKQELPIYIVLSLGIASDNYLTINNRDHWQKAIKSLWK